MGLNENWFRFGENNKHLGYAAWQDRASEKLPAVIVIQEIWGVDGHIKDVARRFAQAGYFAFAPDLFSHDGHRLEHMNAEEIEDAKNFLDQLPKTAWRNEEERKEAMREMPADRQDRLQETIKALFRSTDPELHIARLTDAVDFLQNVNPRTQGQPVASVGFCMGGALSALLAARSANLSGAVIFYGNPPKEEAIADVSCPVLGFYGELDTGITGKIPGFSESMQSAGKSFEHHVYAGVDHAFFNDTRRSYSSAAARDAFARTLAFFNRLQKNNAVR